MGTPLRVMPPARQGRTPVAYGAKPAYSAGLTATHWQFFASAVR
ncbi:MULTISPECIES: hypothetical protein [unclassified Nostoc]|nr:MULTISPECIES: hypothetical protein [unclassified Nostoc]